MHYTGKIPNLKPRGAPFALFDNFDTMEIWKGIPKYFPRLFVNVDLSIGRQFSIT